MTIFDDDGDYAAFERALHDAGTQINTQLLAYCIMPNHWHLLLRPREEGSLGRYMHRLTTTHVRRWHQHRHSTGGGHLYQGTYKSFPIQTDRHFLTVCRYVEANPLRARMVKRAEDWRWCSLWRRRNPDGTTSPDALPPLTRWPVAEPKQWVRTVNAAQTTKEIAAINTSLARGRPFGSAQWQQRTATRLELQSTFRARGRPRIK